MKKVYNISEINKPVDTEEVPSDFKYNLGDWYWLKIEGNEFKNGKQVYFEVEKMCCITHIGSNYIQFTSNEKYQDTYRVHNKNLCKECRPVINPKEEIQKQIDTHKGSINSILEEIKELSKQLVLNPDNSSEISETAVMCIHGSSNIEKYKNELEQAKAMLPELQKELKETTEELVRWMSAETLPLQCQQEIAESTLDKVKEKIFHVSLYGGLLDNVCQFAEGKPAELNTPIHIFQRTCYMDEECLLDYQGGGMNFKRIDAFCGWLKKTVNLNRLLPFPRCIVAFQVRRNSKEYKGISPFISLSFACLDKGTFLFIRNGENLYYLETALDFAPKLFPDKNQFKFEGPMYAKKSFSEIDDMIPERTYLDMKKKYKETKKLYKQWAKENPKKHEFDNPYRDYYDDNVSEYRLIDDNWVYFDDVQKTIVKEAKEYNRISLIIQGLLDRSEVFNPHLPIKLFKSEDFANFVKLIYDGDKIIYAGDKPDFRKYQQELNKHLKKGCFTVGQYDYWWNQLPEKHDRNYNSYKVKHYNDNGPSKIAEVVHYSPKTKKCFYKWTRERSTYNYYKRDIPVTCWLKNVPEDKILCLTNYKAGDYKQFFEDPRTREEYLKWAPLLLAAEDWVNGKNDG